MFLATGLVLEGFLEMGGGAGKNRHPVKQDPADRVGVTGFEIRYLAGSDFDLFPQLKQ